MKILTALAFYAFEYKYHFVLIDKHDFNFHDKWLKTTFKGGN